MPKTLRDVACPRCHSDDCFEVFRRQEDTGVMWCECSVCNRIVLLNATFEIVRSEPHHTAPSVQSA